MRKTLAIIALLMLASTAMGQKPWTSTSQAPHHMAIVQVHTLTGQGTGTIIGVDDTFFYVLSCRHVAEEGKVAVIGSTTGQWTVGMVVKDGGPNVDLSLSRFSLKGSKWDQVISIPIAKVAPATGQFVECTGYGDDGDGIVNLRHWVAKVHGYHAETTNMLMQTSLVGGDSGGGVIFGGHLVGVLYGGKHKTAFDGTEDEDEQQFIHPASATNVYQIQKFLKGSPANAGFYRNRPTPTHKPRPNPNAK